MFHPSAFRRFVRDLLSGPDDLIVHATPADDLTAVAEAVGVFETDLTYQRMRSYQIRAAAYDRIGDFGDEDFAEWDRELLWRNP